jgi:integrase
MACHRIIAASLRQAEKWGDIVVSPARNSSPPSVPKKALNTPPPERVQAVIELAEESPASLHWAELITLAALTGLRRGELCGLQWGDVDMEGSMVTVLRSIWQTSEGGRKWGTKDPKTHQIRRLLLDPVAMTVLSRRLERLEADATLAEVEVDWVDAFVFAPDPITHPPVPLLPSAVSPAFRRLCQKMEGRTGEPWPYRFHDLRHYAATELFAAGFNARTVADRLGHADPALTLRVYAHDTEDQARSAAESLGAGLGLWPALNT